MVAGEIRDPQRNIPLSLIWGVATVGVLYILVNAAVQYVMPASAVAARRAQRQMRSRLALGHAGASLVSIGIAVSMLVTSKRHHHERSPRALRHVARRLFLPEHRKSASAFSHAVGCLLVQCGLSIILLLMGGSFRQFFSLAIFAEWLFYMIAGSTVFVFRRRETERAATLSGVRLSRRSGAFRGRLRRPSLLHVHRQSALFGGGLRGHPGRGTQFSTFSK